MTVEVGHYALVLAFALSLVQAILPLWGSLRGDSQLMAIAPPAALMQFVLVAVSFAALVHAHVVSDFSLVNVVENSNTAKPLIYKITGVWGNHEGSMLLWVLILTLFGALVALFSRDMPEDLRAATLSMQAWISAAFLIFILLASNPFTRLWPAPVQGEDLNPLLQDPGLAIHPPLLYLGYVGLSITFSFAAAALISGRIDAAWARAVRPWTLVAWMFLTLGIAMGSYWSYYTLGWGGFWFWDPVENASLMPWLAATALLHSAAVMEKREALKVWTIFLAVLAFSLSLLGTFLVRSGVLTSVHAFAVDPRRGVFILAILVFFIGGSLALFALRAPMLKPGGIFAPVSREGALVLNNLLLTTCCATVVIGTLYPLALEATTGEKISVGAPFFNLTFVPLFIPIFLAMPLGQTLAWKRGDLLGGAQRLTAAAAVGCACAFAFALLRGGPVFSPIGVGIAAYLIIGSFVEVYGRILARGASLRSAFARARGLPRSAWGAALAHAGIGVTLFGLAATGWGVDKILAVRPGEAIALGPYSVQVGQVAKSQGPNYLQTAMPMTVRSDGRTIARIAPSRRWFPVRRMNVSEAGIATIGFGQVYVSLGDPNKNGTFDARLYWKPFVAFIWLGAIVMAFGGALSLSDRRLRFGFERRAARAAARTHPRTQPAE